MNYEHFPAPENADVFLFYEGRVSVGSTCSWSMHFDDTTGQPIVIDLETDRQVHGLSFMTVLNLVENPEQHDAA